ncbi:hypothetical protein [Roseicella aerolata]|uniref:DUF4426 domain-containing protein n=1 Tax=Roseicella aerolata TaxID=2883479 RepID=A0A9X1IJS1_9PROT|nr:hypothetical protein [Roseicella aerolata]MCB4824913.1 hypothetical protein [Roseicella aerolata]
MGDYLGAQENPPRTGWGVGARWRRRKQTRAALVLPSRRDDVSRRALLIAFAAAAVAALPPRAAALDPEGAFRQVGDLVVYLAAIPAAVVRGHPPEHTGQGMHGGAPEGRYVHHLLVALFDARASRRITDARVTAVVHGLRHTPEDRIALEPMTVGGAQAYGGFATLPARDYYRIEVEVLRPGGAPVRAVFPHRHFQP